MLSFVFDHNWVLLVIFRWQFVDYPVQSVNVHKIGIVLSWTELIPSGCWRQEFDR